MTLVTLREYFAAAGSRYSADDAKVIGPELERLAGPGDELVPGAIVHAASDPISPLHRYFEWDDTKAARRFRLAQANDMKRSILIVPMGSSERNSVDAARPSPVEFQVRPHATPVQRLTAGPTMPGVRAILRRSSQVAIPSLPSNAPARPKSRDEALGIIQAALKPLLEWDEIYHPLASEFDGLRAVFGDVFEAIEHADYLASRLPKASGAAVTP